MKQKLFILVIATVALLAFGQAYASDVTNVELSYNGGFTIARISVDGPIRFTHQTEEAKDGKPFRVIVDILSGTHALGAQTFTFLPDCPVKSIRTSQYAVNPEKVVRIVFDMDAERVYRVESDSRYVTVYFSDNVPRSFAPWSTAAYVASQKHNEETDNLPSVAVSEPTAPASKTAAELNSAINKDRLSSLAQNSPGTPAASTPSQPTAAANSPVVKAEPKVAQVETAPASKSPAKKTFDEPYGPTASTADIHTPVNAEKPAETKTSIPAPVEQESKPVVAAAQQIPAEQKTTVVAVASEPAKSTVTEAPASKQTKPAEEPTVQSKPTPAPDVAQKPDDNSESNEISTAKFRRNPIESKKVKGTLVAQFPQRLVIKYKTSGYRDPFETLINDAKVDNNPIEKRVPNVEGLKLVGIIESGGGTDNRALFEDGDGYGYILATGDKVQKGYVLKVSSDRVYFQIFEYGWSRTVALNLESKS